MNVSDMYVGQRVVLVEDLTSEVALKAFCSTRALDIGATGTIKEILAAGSVGGFDAGVDWDVPPDPGGHLHTLNDTLKDHTGFYIKAEFVEPVDNIEDFKCDYAPVESLF